MQRWMMEETKKKKRPDATKTGRQENRLVMYDAAERTVGIPNSIASSSSLLSHPRILGLNCTMRLFLTLLFGLLPLVLAAKRLSSVIVTYPDNTPDSAIDRDMKDLVDAVCMPLPE